MKIRLDLFNINSYLYIARECKNSNIIFMRQIKRNSDARVKAGFSAGTPKKF